MPEFYKGTNQNVKARIARVLYAPTTYPAPTLLEHVISLSTYEPNNFNYGWEDLGLTLEPLTLPHSVETAGFVTQQRGEIRKTPQEARFLGRTTLGEVTLANKQKFMEGDEVETVSGQQRMKIGKPTVLSNFRMAFLNLDEETGKIDGIILLKAQITGAAGEQSWARGAANTLPIEVEAFPNDDNILTTDGKSVVRIDLQQT